MNADGRAQIGRRAYKVGLCCNLALFAGKLTVSLLAHSMAIAADAVNNLGDCATCLLGLISIYLAAKPADREHPFGHGRAEYVATFVASVMILVVGVELLTASVGRILQPVQTRLSATGAGLIAAAIAVKLAMGTYYAASGRKADSELLRVNSRDSLFDALISGVTLAATLAGTHTSIPLDAWTGAAVSVFVCVSGIGLIRSSVSVLIGRRSDASVVQAITSLAMRHAEVLGIHDLNLHDYGYHHVTGTLHVELPARLTFMQAHAIADAIETEALERIGVQLVVHPDPAGDDSQRVLEVRKQLERILQIVDMNVSAHDIQLDREEGSDRLTFDLMIPYRYSEAQAQEVIERVKSAIREELPELDCRIRTDRG